MSRRGWVIAGLAVIAAAGAGYTTRDQWWPAGAKAQAPAPQTQGPRAVPVDVAKAVKREVPVTVDSLGTVTPVASVAIKSRLETEIVEVHFVDGAEVKEGDLLFSLDGRAIEAQIAQTEGLLRRDQAQLEGAERDLKRATDLLSRNAGTQVNVDNAKTQSDMLRGTVLADEAALRNLRVQLSYTKIRAPISGRISAANVKVGNFVRPADTAPLAVINQLKPIYIAFAVPQRWLSDLRTALRNNSGQVEAALPREPEPPIGRLVMIDNSVDATTGMVMVRALMNNSDEALWPGTLVNVTLTLRTEQAVTVPSAAVQTGQTGPYVFVVRDGAVSMRPVTVARTIGADSVLASGLDGGETVVVDGHMLLAEGSKVAPRGPKVGS